MIDWTGFIARISAARRILLTGHIRPDGDSIGSQVAMARILNSLGKEVRSVNGHPVPPNLKTVDPEGLIRVLAEQQESDRAWIDALEAPDVLLVLDTSSWQQLGPMGDIVKTTRAIKMVLDHHAVGDDLGAEMVVDQQAEATGRLVFEAAKALGVSLDARIADPIFDAITTDTGWFRFASVNPGTFRVAAELLEAGTRVDERYRALYEQESLGRLRLIGRALAKTESHDGWLMLTSITVEDLDQAGALPSDTEDIVNMTLQVQGALAAAILVEQHSGGYKISFRSRCGIDCSLLAREFGGGGHKKAAGAFIDKPFEETRRLVLQAIRNRHDEI